MDLSGRNLAPRLLLLKASDSLPSPYSFQEVVKFMCEIVFVEPAGRVKLTLLEEDRLQSTLDSVNQQE